MRRLIRAGLFATACACASIATAEPAPKFPIVFTSPEVIDETGVSVRFFPNPDNISEQPKPHYPNACFEVLDEGGSYISVSDEVLAAYTARGFTLRSLCLGLVSQAKFDPETGARLATYVYRDTAREQLMLERDAATIDTWDAKRLSFHVPRYHKSKEALKAAIIKAIENYKNGNFDAKSLPEDLAIAGYITEEQPLSVPDCFKNGTPYLDCTWNYGMKSGRKTRAGLADRFKAFGQAYDAQITDLIKNGPTETSGTGEPAHPGIRGLYLGGWRYQRFTREADGYTYGALYDGQPEAFAILKETAHLTDSTFFIVHPSFPRGYGYALNATGEKDSGVSTASIIATYDGTRSSSRFGKSLLKRLVNWPR